MCLFFLGPQHVRLDVHKHSSARIARSLERARATWSLRAPGCRLVSFVAPLDLVVRHLPLQDGHRYPMICPTVPLHMIATRHANLLKPCRCTGCLPAQSWKTGKLESWKTAGESTEFKRLEIANWMREVNQAAGQKPLNEKFLMNSL